MNDSAVSPAAAPRRWRHVILLLLAVVAVAAVVYVLWSRFFSPPDIRDQYLFSTVQRTAIEEVVTAIGTLQPREYVDVGAQVSGQLMRIHVEVGDRVQAGDLLAEIDPTVQESKVQAARAQLRNQRAQLMARESDLLLAEVQYDRQRNLMAEDATTVEALQSAEAALRSARAQIEAIKAQIEQSESNLRADEANLNYTRIEAPMSGTVVSITARQGQTLNATQQAPTILTIADLSTMTVETQVSEADVSRLVPGMEVYFTTLGDQGRRWNSTLRRVEPTPTVVNNVVLYNALFDVPNPTGRLMTQMTAQVHFVVDKAENALVVPRSAVSVQVPPRGPGEGAGPRRVQEGDGAPSRPREAGAMPVSLGDAEPRRQTPDDARVPGRGTVRVLLPDGRLEERAVAVGVTTRIQTQVLEGLEEGMEVVTGQRVSSSATPARSSSGPGGGPLRMPR